MTNHSNKKKFWLIALLIPLFCAAFSLLYLPYSPPLPSYLWGAQELVKGNGLINHRNIGYTLWVFLGLKLHDIAGVFAIQTILYLGICFMTYLLLKQLKAGSFFASVGSALVALHPILVLNIKRISDNNLSLFLLIALILVLLKIDKTSRPLPYFFLTGIILSFMFLVRSNFVFLIPMVFIPFDAARKLWQIKYPLSKTIVICCAIIAACSINYCMKGEFSLVSKYYAAYTFHNGNNHRSAEYFLKYTTGENSTFAALSDHKINILKFDLNQQAEIFFQQSLQFIREDPLRYLSLIPVRTYVFFKPDYRRIKAAEIISPQAVFIFQTILASPFFIWLGLRIFLRKETIRCVGFHAPIVLMLYLLPFILIYSDPRYRWPIDCILIIDSVYLISMSIHGKIK